MEKGWWFGVHNNHRSIEVCSGLRAPQLRILPRPCPISGVRAKIILYMLVSNMYYRYNLSVDIRSSNSGICFGMTLNSEADHISLMNTSDEGC